MVASFFETNNQVFIEYLKFDINVVYFGEIRVVCGDTHPGHRRGQ